MGVLQVMEVALQVPFPNLLLIHLHFTMEVICILISYLIQC